MTSISARTRRPGSARSRGPWVNVAGMLTAVVGIVTQIATGIDYPTIPPGPIVLVAASAIVVSGRWRWAPLVGVVVPLFLLVGGTIASFARDDLWDTGEPGQFAGLLIQAVGLVVALVAGIRALPARRSSR